MFVVELSTNLYVTEQWLHFTLVSPSLSIFVNSFQTSERPCAFPFPFLFWFSALDYCDEVILVALEVVSADTKTALVSSLSGGGENGSSDMLLMYWRGCYCELRQL